MVQCLTITISGLAQRFSGTLRSKLQMAARLAADFLSTGREGKSSATDSADLTDFNPLNPLNPWLIFRPHGLADIVRHLLVGAIVLAALIAVSIVEFSNRPGGGAAQSAEP